MTDKELLKKTAERLRKIAEDTQRITTGNMSHNLTCLRGFALRAAESIERHLQEEPVSNDLEEAIKKYLKSLRKSHFEGYDIERAFKKGAQWQEGQMEKNRIEHCDNITEEQYNLETEFLDDFLDKNKRMPTFLDAIEYGMQKAQKGE